MSALVLDGHSPAAVETVQALGRAGIPVDVSATSADALAFCSRYPRKRLTQPNPASAEEFIQWLRAVADEAGYKLIVPATEASLGFLATLPHGDALLHKAVLPAPAALRTALDKEAVWKLAASLGVPVPASKLIAPGDQATPPARFPVVLKPVRSKVLQNGQLISLRPAIVTREAEWREAMEEFIPVTSVQQQDYAAGHGVGVELLFEHGRKLWHFAHERIHELPLTGGGSTYRRSIEAPPDLLADAEKLLQALGWHGVAMVEFRVNRAGNRALMEINPRFWGSLALSVDAGVNFPLGLYRLSRGESPGPQPACRTNYFTRQLSRDWEWQKANARAEHSNPLLLTRPRWRAALEPLRVLVGRESWDHFDWRDLGVTRKVLGGVLSQFNGAVQSRLRNWKLRRQLRQRQTRLLQTGAGKIRRLLFVCHGNIGRSPTAEKLAQQVIPGCEIASAGFHSRADRPSPPHVRKVAAELGVDLEGWHSRCLTREMVDQADLILLMDLRNAARFNQEFPHAAARATLLGYFGSSPATEIPDPYEQSLAFTRRSLSGVKNSVEGLARWLAAGRG